MTMVHFWTTTTFLILSSVEVYDKYDEKRLSKQKSTCMWMCVCVCSFIWVAKYKTFLSAAPRLTLSSNIILLSYSSCRHWNFIHVSYWGAIQALHEVRTLFFVALQPKIDKNDDTSQQRQQNKLFCRKQSDLAIANQTNRIVFGYTAEAFSRPEAINTVKCTLYFYARWIFFAMLFHFMKIHRFDKHICTFSAYGFLQARSTHDNTIVVTFSCRIVVWRDEFDVILDSM